MANCPKCGVKLKLTDIDQCCPKCGVNMRLYGFRENFYKEAKTAELSQAGYSCKIRRFRTAMIGSKLMIARLCVMLLPLLSMLIPAGSVQISFPFREASLAISALGLYTAFSGGELNLIMSFASGGAEAAVFSMLKITMILIAVTAVFAFLTFAFCVFCFCSLKKMQKVNCVNAALGFVSALASLVCMYIFNGKTGTSVILSSSAGFGLYVVLLMFAVVFTINFLIDKKGIKIEYPEGMVERSEIWKKVLAGEVNIDDLPYPVVETEETRKIHEEVLAQKAAMRGEKTEEKEENTDEAEKG